MSEVSTITEKVQNAERAENKLIDLKAKKNSTEKYLGVPSKGDIIDVQTEDLEDGIVIQFIINLPTDETGYINFTEYMVENGELDIFLNYINCTRNNVTDGFYEEVPVTYTDWHGWKVFYSDYESRLKTHSGDSNWRVLDPSLGSKRPNRKLSLLYHSTFILSFISVVYHYGISDGSFIFGIMLGIIVWGMSWYFDAAWCGMTSPRETKIKV